MPTIVPIRVSTNGPGGAANVQGQLDGEAGRTVTLEAIANSGYVFSHWEITVKPVQLYTFALVSDQPMPSLNEICALDDKGQYAAVSREWFTDGQQIYLDLNKTPVPTGYWAAGTGQYYYYNGFTLPTRQQCSVQPKTGTGGDTGGDGEGTITPPPTDTGDDPIINKDDGIEREL